MKTASTLPLAGLLHLLVTYIVWGSTYLAIRVAVREGAGWGPFWLGASRVLVAAVVLFAFNRIRRQRLRPSAAELGVLAATGLLLWVGGNGAVNWAEQRIDSGLAALIVGSMPMWVAFMESLIDRRAPTLLLAGSLVTGFGGLVVLTYPMLRGGLSADLLGVVAVVFAAVSWGFGSIIVNRRPLELDPVVVSSWQQLIGGIGFAVLAVSAGEPAPAPTTEAWIAWAYLVVFGSLLAYTSFVYALKLLPTTVVMTYAYVNPAIAVLLGWLILSEPITAYTLAGMALIIAGVYGVFLDKGRRSTN
jgi:drug/metabolite transporter (DMT)-like permease